MATTADSSMANTRNSHLSTTASLAGISLPVRVCLLSVKGLCVNVAASRILQEGRKVLVQTRFPRQTSNRPWGAFDLCDLYGGTGHIWPTRFEIN